MIPDLVLLVTASLACAPRIRHQHKCSTKLPARLPSLRGCFCCLERIADLLPGVLVPI